MHLKRIGSRFRCPLCLRIGYGEGFITEESEICLDYSCMHCGYQALVDYDSPTFCGTVPYEMIQFIKWAKLPRHVNIIVPWIPQEVLYGYLNHRACHVRAAMVDGQFYWRRIASEIDARTVVDSLDYIDFKRFTEALKPSNEAVRAFAAILRMKNQPQIKLLRG